MRKNIRRVLQDLADSLYPARDDVVKKIDGKDTTIKLGADAYINRIVAYCEENADSERFKEIVGSHMGFLGDRLDAVKIAKIYKTIVDNDIYPTYEKKHINKILANLKKKDRLEIRNAYRLFIFIDLKYRVNNL
jgi:hypothetical protein